MGALVNHSFILTSVSCLNAFLVKHEISSFKDQFNFTNFTAQNYVLKVFISTDYQTNFINMSNMTEYDVLDVEPFLYVTTGSVNQANSVSVTIANNQPLRLHSLYACLPFYYYIVPSKNIQILYVNAIIKGDMLILDGTKTSYNTQFTCKLTDAWSG
jgi:hypothetical protein